MMVDNPLRAGIEAFVHDVGEHVDQNYVLVEAVTAQQFNRMQQRNYIRRVIDHSDNTKRKILEVLEASWDARIRHGRVHSKARHWGRAASGFAHYLLKPKDMEQVNVDAAADLVVRISRWRYTRNCNVWVRFRPYACRVVELALGEIEDFQNNRNR